MRADAELRTGHPREARQWLTSAIPTIERSGDRAALRKAVNQLGVAEVELGALDAAERVFSRALELARSDGDDLLVAHATNNMGAIANIRGRREEALTLYQLAIPAPSPKAKVDFDSAAAKRGDKLFSGKAGCNNCHVEPLWTEPGWNLHKPEEIGIDSFQADRGPDNVYKTMNLNSLFIREEGLFRNPSNKGRFYHDGRFATLLDVVNHYNVHFNLGLTNREKLDLVEYLKSLPSPE